MLHVTWEVYEIPYANIKIFHWTESSSEFNSLSTTPEMDTDDIVRCQKLDY